MFRSRKGSGMCPMAGFVVSGIGTCVLALFEVFITPTLNFKTGVLSLHSAFMYSETNKGKPEVKGIHP
jgi:hypothetical protein